jgi:hypothetical protein
VKLKKINEKLCDDLYNELMKLVYKQVADDNLKPHHFNKLITLNNKDNTNWHRIINCINENITNAVVK